MKIEMKNKFGMLCGLIASSILVSCETPLKVTSDYDRGVNFSNYKSFEMLSVDREAGALSPLNADRILNAVKAEMVSKGFTEVTEDADLKVNAVTIMKDKQEVTATTNYYGYGGYYRPYGWAGSGGGHTTIDVDEYTDGSIIIAVVDAATEKLIWEGVGNKKIDAPSKNPDETIPEAIKKIMSEFPPKKSSKSSKSKK
jgi:hypothetical protein